MTLLLLGDEETAMLMPFTKRPQLLLMHAAAYKPVQTLYNKAICNTAWVYGVYG